LRHLLPNHSESDVEKQARIELSVRLSGHALAISQMAALINTKKMSVATFVPYYDKYTRKIYRERKTGWKYVGSNHEGALDTMWLLSFGALSDKAKTCLSLFAFLDPERIPDNIFDVPDTRPCQDTDLSTHSYHDRRGSIAVVFSRFAGSRGGVSMLIDQWAWSCLLRFRS
jgi:hypothetical protein